jgi:hypothetical protein
LPFYDTLTHAGIVQLSKYNRLLLDQLNTSFSLQVCEFYCRNKFDKGIDNGSSYTLSALYLSWMKLGGLLSISLAASIQATIVSHRIHRFCSTPLEYLSDITSPTSCTYISSRFLDLSSSLPGLVPCKHEVLPEFEPSTNIVAISRSSLPHANRCLRFNIDLCNVTVLSSKHSRHK